jgi:hypothetical protein
MKTRNSLRRATAKDLVMFASPSQWPVRPFLPLTRQLPESRETELGLLYDARGASGLYGYGATVFRVNLLDLPATDAEFLSLPHYTYDTFDELADDGWIVD